MTWVGWILFLLWLNGILRVAPMIRNGHLEDRVGDRAPQGGFPLLSVIVPARNEELDIESCLTSILATDYPHLEIIAINDRSTDRTGQILDRVAAEDSRIQIIHIETLPEGWLGKNHALQTGADRARGDYLLFTDGDIVFEPHCFNRAVNYMLQSGVDHLALVPGGLGGHALENTFKTFFLFGYLLFIKTQEPIADGRHSYFGFGAFNMVRRKTYERVGGHASFPMDVVDDLILGRRIKDKGGKQELLFATHSLALHWYRGVLPAIHGLEKNMFASFEYSWGRTFFALFMFVFYYLVGYAGILLLPDPSGYGFLLATLAMHGLFGYLGSKFKIKAWCHVFIPLVVLIEMYAIVRSCWKTWRQGGVRWRDTFYSLETLKRTRYRGEV